MTSFSFSKDNTGYNPADLVGTSRRLSPVGADNNGSERAIRNVKVKTKVSGQLRTEKGAERFAILRSVVDTAIKNGQNAYDAIAAIENMAPT